MQLRSGEREKKRLPVFVLLLLPCCGRHTFVVVVVFVVLGAKTVLLLLFFFRFFSAGFYSATYVCVRVHCVCISVSAPLIELKKKEKREKVASLINTHNKLKFLLCFENT